MCGTPQDAEMLDGAFRVRYERAAHLRWEASGQGGPQLAGVAARAKASRARDGGQVVSWRAGRSSARCRPCPRAARPR